MATDDATLQAEVRLLTDYDATIIADADLLEVVSLAKREIRTKVGIIDLDFYGTDKLNEERALFWLSCLFAKVRAGELEGVEMSIGDIENKPLRVDREGQDAVIWQQEFRAYLGQITPSDAIFGIRSVSRSDRTYGYE